jgi:hypothetical protein
MATELCLVEALNSAPRPPKRGSREYAGKLWGVPVVITYELTGKRVRDTHDEPGYGPELEVITVEYQGVDVSVFDCGITDEAWNVLEDMQPWEDL